MTAFANLSPEVRKKLVFGKPLSHDTFVVVSAETYQKLSEKQKEVIRFYDPFLRNFGDVYVFWLTEAQVGEVFKYSK